MLFIYNPCFYGYNFLFELYNFNYINNIQRKNVISFSKSDYVLQGNYFDIDQSLNDIIKINDTTIAFIFTSYFTGSMRRINSETDYNSLCIIIIKINQDTYGFSFYNYKIDNNFYELNMQILGYSYNNYLIFATSSLLNNGNNINNEDYNYLSLFMMFGYPNGTDSIIDISIYLESYNNNQQNHNFYEFFKKNLTIENNIFRFISTNNIILLSIPKEILIYEKEVNEIALLKNKSLMKMVYHIY